MSIFTGSATAVCTPFTPEGAFCPHTYERFIRWQGQQGTDAIVSCGTTGEASTLTTEEHIEVVRTAVLAAKAAGEARSRPLPVVAGAGGNHTAKDIKMARALQQAGADALMFVTPYYNKTSQRGLVEHYTALARAVDIPIIVYNIPGRTGLNLQAATLAMLAKVPNIVGIKEASGDMGQVAEMAERCGPDFAIYSGNDDYILPILSYGGRGVISTIANIIPDRVHDMVGQFRAGNLEAARALQLGILPLVRQLFADINPMPVKAALNMLGFDMGRCRAPLTTIDPALAAGLRQALTDYGVDMVPQA